MSLWRTPGVPHKGWRCVDVNDTGEPTSLCEMCGQSNVRYVHIMTHDDYHREVEAGCVCAGHMEVDRLSAKRRERVLRRWANRRAHFISRPWRKSAAGNFYMKIKGNLFVIMESRFEPGRWAASFNGAFSRYTYNDVEDAKRAIFESLDSKPSFVNMMDAEVA